VVNVPTSNEVEVVMRVMRSNMARDSRFFQWQDLLQLMYHTSASSLSCRDYMVLTINGHRYGKHSSSKESTAEVNHYTAGEALICRNRTAMLGLSGDETSMSANEFTQRTKLRLHCYRDLSIEMQHG